MQFQLAQLISILVGGILPLVTGLVTKSSWSGGARAVVLLLLAGATGVLTDYLGALTGGGAFDWPTVVTAAFLTFLSGVGTYFGLWKPTKIAARFQAKFRQPYALPRR